MNNSRTIGENIIYLSEVNSTNLYASQLIKDNKFSEGTVVVAQNQTSGKGQAENKWVSENGKNLTFSVILTPVFLSAERQFLLSKIVSLSIIDFLNKFSILDISIKWPNDIYVGNKKIAGILIENSIKGLKYDTSIVGIGLNINQTQFSADIPNATSLKILLNKDFDLKECLNSLLEKLETWYDQLKLQNYQLIDDEYLNSIYNFNKFLPYIYMYQKITARIIGVNKYGKLQLEKEDNTIIDCDFREIEFTI